MKYVKDHPGAALFLLGILVGVIGIWLATPAPVALVFTGLVISLVGVMVIIGETQE